MLASELEYTLVGNGANPVIVLHEWASGSQLWEGLHGLLDVRTFTYAFVDLPGYGKSRRLKGPYSAKAAAANIVHTANQLGWARFHAVGHSMSGMIVQRVVHESPERVMSLVGVAPVPASGMAIDEEFRNFLLGAAKDVSKARRLSGLLTADRLPESWYAQKYRLMNDQIDEDALRGFLNMWTSENFANELQVAKIPALALVGEHDGDAYSEANMRKSIGSFFENFKIVILKNAGHYPMCETPLRFVRVLEDFLRDATASSEG